MIQLKITWIFLKINSQCALINFWNNLKKLKFSVQNSSCEVVNVSRSFAIAANQHFYLFWKMFVGSHWALVTAKVGGTNKWDVSQERPNRGPHVSFHPLRFRCNKFFKWPDPIGRTPLVEYVDWNSREFSFIFVCWLHFVQSASLYLLVRLLAIRICKWLCLSFSPLTTNQCDSCHTNQWRIFLLILKNVFIHLAGES